MSELLDITGVVASVVAGVVPAQCPDAGAEGPPLQSVPVLDVLVVDDERFFAESLAMALGSTCGDNWAVGSATASQLIRDPRATAASARTIVLGCTGAVQQEALALLEQGRPGVQVVVLLATVDDAPQLPLLVRAGARGWACRTDSLEHLALVVREVSDGGWWMPRTVIGDVLGSLRRTADERVAASFDSLTPRERQVLAGLVEGLTRTAIARRHHMSVNTVRSHIQHLFEKLGVHSCLEAVVLAQGRGPEPLDR
ncbi:MAG: two-component system response regulator [Frankiales bacterium]|jgi:DNA-binding NarL/FixJ family response regulator|nr:two-component system response regulator [Frankiales bacterium]